MEKLTVTPREAAEALTLSMTEMKRRLEIGEIPAYRDGRNWKIPIECLRRYPVEKAMAEAERRRKESVS